MRDFLKGLDLDKETIDTIMAEHGKLITASKENELALKQTLADVEGKLKSFEGVDLDKLHGEIDKLKADLAEKDKEHNAKLADMAFNSALSSAITAYKGKNPKGIMANLDLEALKSSKNQESDIKAALEALKQSDGYFFETETPPPYASGTGQSKMTMSREDFNKLGYAERLKLKQDNPTLFEQMKG